MLVNPSMSFNWTSLFENGPTLENLKQSKPLKPPPTGFGQPKEPQPPLPPENPSQKIHQINNKGFQDQISANILLVQMKNTCTTAMNPPPLPSHSTLRPPPPPFPKKRNGRGVQAAYLLRSLKSQALRTDAVAGAAALHGAPWRRAAQNLRGLRQEPWDAGGIRCGRKAGVSIVCFG